MPKLAGMNVAVPQPSQGTLRIARLGGDVGIFLYLRSMNCRSLHGFNNLGCGQYIPKRVACQWESAQADFELNCHERLFLVGK